MTQIPEFLPVFSVVILLLAVYVLLRIENIKLFIKTGYVKKNYKRGHR